MSISTTAPTTFGQDLGEAAQSIRRQFDALLSESGTSFEAWVIMNLLGRQGPLAAGALRDDLADRLRIDPDAAVALLEQTGRDGITLTESGQNEAGPERYALTAEGHARFASLRERVAQSTASLLAGLPPDDVETTRRTLRAVNERARSLRAL